MEVAQSQQGPVTILTKKGPIVGGEFGPLDSRVDDCVKAGLVRMVLDISDVPFIDSEGLDRILAISSNMGKQGGDARVANPNEVCRDIFKATGIDSMVQILEDRDAAVRTLL